MCRGTAEAARSSVPGERHGGGTAVSARCFVVHVCEASSCATATALCVFIAQAMHNHLRRDGRFIVGFDATGDILGASSDVLHALFFLNNGTAVRVAVRELSVPMFNPE